MKEGSDLKSGLDTSLRVGTSNSKLLGEKQISLDIRDNADPDRKRENQCNLEFVARSDGIDTHYPKSTKYMDANNRLHFGKENIPQLTKNTVTMDSNDVVQAARTASDKFPLLVNGVLKPLDLNTNVSDVGGSSEMVMAWKNKRKKEFDLNLEDVSSTVNQDQHIKSFDMSECASSTAPPIAKADSTKVWKEMGQNDFTSSSYGGIPKPMQHWKKVWEKMAKRKMEIAENKKIEEFVKIATPTGLLHKLNPGIISRVRNSKQVHSIIKEIVRDEKLEKAKQLNTVSENTNDGENYQENRNNFLLRPHISQEHKKNFTVIEKKRLVERTGDADSSIGDRIYIDLDSLSDDEHNTLALNLKSSSAKILDHSSSESTQENTSSVSTLSVKAARVAYDWLELLCQDTKRRLAALRRSKKKIHGVIHTELPMLLLKEFSFNQENDSSATQSTLSCSKEAIADLHQMRWNMLFNQMDGVLSEEEKQLECLLNQVITMQKQCDKGLRRSHMNRTLCSNSSRSANVDSSEVDSAVTAAAAALYSTCNYLLSKGNTQGL